MDFAAQQAIDACGSCGRPEREHQLPAGDGDAGEVAAVLFAIAGQSGTACAHYVASDAALRYQRFLAIANWRPGRRQAGRCSRCGNRGHGRKDCPL